MKKRVAYIFHPFFMFLISLTFFSSASFADFRFTPETHDAYQNLLKFKIHSANNIIQSSLIENPNDGIAIYLDNYSNILTLFINENPQLYKEFAAKEDTRLNKIKSINPKSPYNLFLQAEIKLQWAFVKLKFGDDLSAVWSIRQAYSLLEENKKKFPDFLPNKKTLGLMHILIGSIPEKYTWVANLVGMYGSVPAGMAMLDEVIKRDPVFSLEGKLLKMAATYYILHTETTSLHNLKQVHLSHKDNLLVTFMYASILLKEGLSEQALQVIMHAPVGKDYISMPFLNYMRGMLMLNKGEYIGSRNYFNKFLKEHKGKNFIKDTYYRLFLTYWLTGKDEEAHSYIDEIINNGAAIYDADKYAESFAKNKDFPHKSLMKARLFTDGGYYEQARTCLNNMTGSKVSTKEKIEYYYRYARVFHKTSEIKRAKEMYVKTIEESGILPYYFAPNSALQMGYIFKEEKDKEKAAKYFKLALSYKSHEYKNSIDNKAKAALNDLKN